MAVRKLPNGRRAIEFENRGRRVFRRLPAGATKAQADEYELKLRRELIDQALLGKSPTVPLPTAIDDWFKAVVVGRKDERATKSKVAIVKAAVASLHLTRGGITAAAEKILAMGRKKGEKPLAAATMNRRLSVLKATAKWAWKKRHWTAENLSPYVILLDKRLERVRSKTATQAQVERLIAAAGDVQTKAYIALGCYGLMRTGEIMNATQEDVGRGLTLPKTKSGEPRVVPIVPALRPFLKALPLTLHRRTLYERFLVARAATGLHGLVHHDLRRSGATILLNSGHVSLELVAHILGDSLEVARKHYAKVLNRTAEKAMRKGFKPIKNPSARRRTGVSA